MDITPPGRPTRILMDEENVVETTLSVMFSLQTFPPTIQLDIMRIVADLLAAKEQVKHDTDHQQRMKRLFDKKGEK